MLYPTPQARHNRRTNPLLASPVIPFVMCKPTSPAPKSIGSAAYTSSSRSNIFLRNVSIIVPPFLRNNHLFTPPHSKKKTALLIILSLFLVTTLLFTSLYTFHRGFRRTIQFWRGLSPIVVKYKWLQLKAHRIDRCDDEEYQRRITVFRQVSAPQLVDLIVSLGGIYVKIGQVMSTIGAGLLPEEYIQHTSSASIARWSPCQRYQRNHKNHRD